MDSDFLSSSWIPSPFFSPSVLIFSPLLSSLLFYSFLSLLLSLPPLVSLSLLSSPLSFPPFLSLFLPTFYLFSPPLFSPTSPYFFSFLLFLSYPILSPSPPSLVLGKLFDLGLPANKMKIIMHPLRMPLKNNWPVFTEHFEENCCKDVLLAQEFFLVQISNRGGGPCWECGPCSWTLPPGSVGSVMEVGPDDSLGLPEL